MTCQLFAGFVVPVNGKDRGTLALGDRIKMTLCGRLFVNGAER
jgi:hypothetical protein